MESQLDTGLVSVLVALLVPWADVLAVSMAPESVSLLAAPLALPMDTPSTPLMWYYPSNSAQVAPSCLM